MALFYWISHHQVITGNIAVHRFLHWPAKSALACRLKWKLTLTDCMGKKALFAYVANSNIYLWCIRQRAIPVQHVLSAKGELVAVPCSVHSARDEGRIYTFVAHAQCN